MRTKGILLIVSGVAGVIFVCIYDLLVGRGRISIIGPRSFTALAICAGLIIAGIIYISKKEPW